MLIVIDDPVDENATATWVHVCGANPTVGSFKFWAEPDDFNSKPTLVKVRLAGFIYRAIPFDLLVASEKSMIRAMLVYGTGATTFIQNVIEAAVKQKYVSVGSVR